jgi:hypothetical protein
MMEELGKTDSNQRAAPSRTEIVANIAIKDEKTLQDVVRDGEMD